MRHGILIAVLGFGAVAGFAAGFHRLREHRSGDYCHYHSRIERRAAEVCTRAALDAVEQRKTAAQNR
jgi:hypothetical protein